MEIESDRDLRSIEASIGIIKKDAEEREDVDRGE